MEDEFSEKLQGVGDIFNPKIYIADFGPLYRASSDVYRKKLQYNFPKMREGGGWPFGFFRKFIQFGSATLP